MNYDELIEESQAKELVLMTEMSVVKEAILKDSPDYKQPALWNPHRGRFDVPTRYELVCLLEEASYHYYQAVDETVELMRKKHESLNPVSFWKKLFRKI